MKKLVLPIILLYAAQIFSAQPDTKINTETIDLKKMVKEQIEEIREAEEVKVKVESETVIKSGAEQSSYSNDSILSGLNSSVIKIFVLVEAALLVSMIIVYRRKKISSKPEKVNLKENILKLRNEEIQSLNDEKLAKLRKSLKNQRLEVKNMGRSITKKAKKLSVSKGEVHLAAKLNMLSGTNR